MKRSVFVLIPLFTTLFLITNIVFVKGALQTEIPYFAQRGVISSSGERVAFQSISSIVPEDSFGSVDAYIYERFSDTYILVTQTYSGTVNDDCGSSSPKLSYDGTKVVFMSTCPNLVPNDPNGSTRDIFWRDIQTGVNKLVSISSGGVPPNNAPGPSANYAISGNGRYVAFESNATNLVPNDTNNRLDIFVHDTQTRQTYRVSVASDGTQGNSDSFAPTISYDGRYIAFSSYSNNFVTGTNGGNYVFLHDMFTGVTSLVSQTLDGISVTGGSPSISGDGRYIAFVTNESVYPEDNDNGLGSDIYLKDRLTGQLIFASNYQLEGELDDFVNPNISLDGGFIVFNADSWSISEGIFLFNRSNNTVVKVTDDSETLIADDPTISAYGISLVYNDGSRVHIIDPETSSQIPNLSIETINLAHQSVSSGQWIPINSSVDGNIVRITAQIRNIDDFSGPALIKFSNAQTGEVIDFVPQLSFPAGQITPVNYEWDTTGYAWNDDSTPNTSPIQIQVTISDFSQSDVIDEETAQLQITPKPVILVHGLWSDASTWESYATFLNDINSEWSAYAVGDGQANSNGEMDTGVTWLPFLTSNTIDENASELDTYIQDVRETLDAWQVDIVAHSMGGLISRYYIQNFMPYEGRPVVSRLLMMGTPNGGSVCADIISTISPFAWMPVIEQLRTDYLPVFNTEITQRRSVEFAILAGNTYQLPCSFPEGDGVVSVNSALAIPIADNTSRTANFHDEMTGSIENFTLFVQPRLTNVVANKAFEETNIEGEMQVRQGVVSNPQLTYGAVIDILPSETQAIQLPQLGGSQLHVLLTNVSTINANLRDPANVIVDSVIANSNEANQIFVSMLAGSVTPGTYVLELSNIDIEAKSVSVGVWVEDDPTQLELVVTNLDQPNQMILSQDQIHILATFTNDGNPIIGADLIVQIVDESGGEMTITLFDDGNHEDGQANDGTYGFVLENLIPDTYIFRVQAEGDGITRLNSRLAKIAPHQTFLPMVVR